MAANIVECNGQDFKGLKNPYTGEDMIVKMVVTSDGNVFFFAPETYSTAESFGTFNEARRMWSRVDGIFGCRPTDDVARCAYTGEILVPTENGSFTGGFDPRSFHTRDEFLYHAWMRDGKSKYPKPEGTTRVTTVEETAPMPKTHEAEYVEGALEEAEAAIKKSGVQFEKRSTITAGIKLSKGKKHG